MKKIICLFLALLISCSLVGCGSNDNTQSDASISATTPSQGEYVYLTNDFITEWLNNYTHGSASSYALAEKYDELYYPKETITLSWTDSSDCDSYTVYLDTKEDLSSAKTYHVTVTNKVVDVYNLNVGKDYYWRVVGLKNGGVETVSEVFHFMTAFTPRTIYIDGVSNTRDVGGYMTSFGKQVKQGMVYRTAKTENVTELGKTQIAEMYKIKTEIDLRGAFPEQKDPNSSNYSIAEENICLDHVANGSSLGANVVYKYFWTPSYMYDTVPGFTSLKYLDPVTNEYENDKQFITIMKEFANVDNYPIAFHCTAGRDRTGTVACVLNALLGVGAEDLYLDYEFSYLSIDATNDQPSVAGKINEFESILKYLYTFDGENLAEKTANYLMTYGMTQAEIDTIREIMLED